MDEWITNPLTNRKIKVNGRQYNSLVRANIIKTKEIKIKDVNEIIEEKKKPKYELIDLSKDQFEIVDKPKEN